MKVENFEAAVHFYGKAIELNPANAVYFCNRYARRPRSHRRRVAGAAGDTKTRGGGADGGSRVWLGLCPFSSLNCTRRRDVGTKRCVRFRRSAVHATAAWRPSGTVSSTLVHAREGEATWAAAWPHCGACRGSVARGVAVVAVLEAHCAGDARRRGTWPTSPRAEALFLFPSFIDFIFLYIFFGETMLDWQKSCKAAWSPRALSRPDCGSLSPFSLTPHCTSEQSGNIIPGVARK